MNPETKFGRRFKKKLPSGHIMRVENPAHPGTPDLNLCINGVEAWVEFKQVKALPKRAETPVFTNCLEPHQALWHHLRAKAGGHSYIAGYVEAEDLTFIIPGSYAMEFNSFNLEKLNELTVPMECIWTL